MSSLILGALAHVDAGKTSLCEAILYKTNTTRKLGRIDHRDAFLDYSLLERQRGITIFNKEARFSFNDKNYVYLDTPGHLDLKRESSRAIKVIDVALLIVSGNDPLYSDVISTFNNLINLNIPTIIFVNKMDISNYNKDEILNNIHNKLSPSCIEVKDIEEYLALDNEEPVFRSLHH